MASIPSKDLLQIKLNFKSIKWKYYFDAIPMLKLPVKKPSGCTIWRVFVLEISAEGYPLPRVPPTGLQNSMEYPILVFSHGNNKENYWRWSQIERSRLLLEHKTTKEESCCHKFLAPHLTPWNYLRTEIHNLAPRGCFLPFYFWEECTKNSSGRITYTIVYIFIVIFQFDVRF